MNKNEIKTRCKTLHELGVEFEIRKASKREIALELIGRAERKGVSVHELLNKDIR